MVNDTRMLALLKSKLCWFECDLWLSKICHQFAMRLDNKTCLPFNFYLFPSSSPLRPIAFLITIIRPFHEMLPDPPNIRTRFGNRSHAILLLKINPFVFFEHHRRGKRSSGISSPVTCGWRRWESTSAVSTTTTWSKCTFLGFRILIVEFTVQKAVV